MPKKVTDDYTSPEELQKYYLRAEELRRDFLQTAVKKLESLQGQLDKGPVPFDDETLGYYAQCLYDYPKEQQAFIREYQRRMPEKIYPPTPFRDPYERKTSAPKQPSSLARRMKGVFTNKDRAAHPSPEQRMSHDPKEKDFLDYRAILLEKISARVQQIKEELSEPAITESLGKRSSPPVEGTEPIQLPSTGYKTEQQSTFRLQVLHWSYQYQDIEKRKAYLEANQGRLDRLKALEPIFTEQIDAQQIALDDLRRTTDPMQKKTILEGLRAERPTLLKMLQEIQELDEAIRTPPQLSGQEQKRYSDQLEQRKALDISTPGIERAIQIQKNLEDYLWEEQCANDRRVDAQEIFNDFFGKQQDKRIPRPSFEKLPAQSSIEHVMGPGREKLIGELRKAMDAFRKEQSPAHAQALTNIIQEALQRKDFRLTLFKSNKAFPHTMKAFIRSLQDKFPEHFSLDLVIESIRLQRDKKVEELFDEFFGRHILPNKERLNFHEIPHGAKLDKPSKQRIKGMKEAMKAYKEDPSQTHAQALTDKIQEASKTHNTAFSMVLEAFATSLHDNFPDDFREDLLQASSSYGRSA